MPNKIATIGDNAFQGTKLASIELPGALTTLGANAFEGCPALKEVTFAFSGWKDNEKYDTKLDNAVTSIGNAAFMTCPSLTSVKLPVNALTTLGDDVFNGDFALAGAFDLPKTVTTTGARASSRRSSLRSR